MDEPAEIFVPRRKRVGAFVLVAIVHVLVILGLIRAFAPDYAARAVDSVLSTFQVTVTTPPPSPQPSAAGKSGEAGKKAVARPVAAPRPKVAVARPSAAPRVSSSGAANSSGAMDQGAGTGAGGPGEGTGSGAGGNGQGGGAASKAVLVSGQISNAADFPVPPGGREARIGKSVILELTVGTDGRPSACRIYRSSGFPDTDATACRLALQRLRFRAATNAAGEPVVSTFYWQQKFFF